MCCSENMVFRDDHSPAMMLILVFGKPIFDLCNPRLRATLSTRSVYDVRCCFWHPENVIRYKIARERQGTFRNNISITIKMIPTKVNNTCPFLELHRRIHIHLAHRFFYRIQFYVEPVPLPVQPPFLLSSYVVLQ